MRVAVDSKPQAAFSATRAAITPSPRPRCRSLASPLARPNPTQATLEAAYQVTRSSVAAEGFTAHASSWWTQRNAKTQRLARTMRLREISATTAQLAATARAARLSLVRNGVYPQDGRCVSKTSAPTPASARATGGAHFQLRFGTGRSRSAKSAALPATAATAGLSEEPNATRMARF